MVVTDGAIALGLAGLPLVAPRPLTICRLTPLKRSVDFFVVPTVTFQLLYGFVVTAARPS